MSMQVKVMMRSLKILIKQISTSEFENAKLLVSSKVSYFKSAIEVESDEGTKEKFFNLMTKYEKLLKSLELNKNDYCIDSQAKQTDEKSILAEISILWNEWEKNTTEISIRNDKDVYEYFQILMGKKGKILFQAHEIIGIEFLKMEYHNVYLNRSHLKGELAIKCENEYDNSLEKYKAAELGYENRQDIPWVIKETSYFSLNEKGIPSKVNISNDSISFIHISNFQ
jgi:hypothetical protein